MDENELHRYLGVLTINKDAWEENILYIASHLALASVKIQAKALWLPGEIGLKYPDEITPHVAKKVYLCSDNRTHKIVTKYLNR